MADQIRSGAQNPNKRRRRKRRGKPLILKILGGIGTTILTTFLSFFLLFALTGTICAVAATLYVTNYMDNTLPISIEEQTMSYATNIYEFDSNGDKINVYSVQSEIQRIPVTLDKVPQHTRDAFTCAEDERFYQHEGVDYKRTAASFANMILKFWATEQGGSTITQQLVKNISGDNDLSPQRKIREIQRAMLLEKNYSKDEILESYLNWIGFGGAANGIEMAARKYFGKHVEELSIAESACLAAIPQSPEINNPFAGYNERAKNEVTGTWYVTDTFHNTGREVNRKRMEYILGHMYNNGAITFDEYQQALNEHLIFTDTDEYLRLHPELQEVKEDGTIVLGDGQEDKPTSWAVDEAIYEFANRLMEDRGISFDRALNIINNGGYQIYTTVNRDMQAYLEEKFMDMNNLLANMGINKNSTTITRDKNRDGIYDESEALYLQAGFTAIDYEGRVLCTCGGIGPKNGSLGTSFASNEPQQPGSAIKPVTSYGYALENDYISWGTHVLDYPPLTVKDEHGKEKLWPTNYSDTNDTTVYSNQKICIYYALEKSYNTIPALLVKNYTPENIYNFATKTLGLNLNEGYDKDYAPLSVGALGYGITVKDLVNAYMVYGNGGYFSDAHIISKVETTDGQIYYDNSKNYNRVISEETSYVMNKLLQNVVQNGTGTAARMFANGREIPIAGKTGTTSDWTDLMFVGLTPDFVSGVWIGYKENVTIQNHWPIKSALVWKNIIGEWIQKNYSGNDFPACDKCIQGQVCAITGKIAGVNCPKGTVGYWKSTNQPWCDNRELSLGLAF